MQSDGRIDTPVDERGVADLDATVALGLRMVHPDYIWSPARVDTHHLQWPESFYSSAGEFTLGQEFRELYGRRVNIPRQFHNWIHYITFPPPVPDPEVMRQSVRAEKIAVAVASTAALAMQLTRIPGIPDSKLSERLKEEHEKYLALLALAETVPSEFRLLDPSEQTAANIDAMLAANKQLGRMALRSVPVRHRHIPTLVA